MAGFWSWPRLFTRNGANRTSFIIASLLVFLEKVSSVCGLKIILMLTQKQISTNQVTMGQVHLFFSFEQPMMKIKNFLQSHLQATPLKIKKNWYLCLLNILQSKIYTLLNLKMNFGHLRLLVMCHQQSFHLTIHQLLKSSNGSLFVQKISRQNYSIKMFIPWMGCTSCITETWHTNSTRYQYYSSIITR